MIPQYFAGAFRRRKMVLRDMFWLWGHPEGAYNHKYGNDKLSRMTPMEGCLYLGVKNTFMIPAGEKEVNRRQYNKSFKTLKEVGWECYNAGENPSLVEPFISEAKEFENIGRVVFSVGARGDAGIFLKNLNQHGGIGISDLVCDVADGEGRRAQQLGRLPNTQLRDIFHKAGAQIVLEKVGHIGIIE